jgi:shikimate dehydrogenase
MPHKTEVIKYLDEIAADAKLMGAVNTIRKEGSKLIGENTDGKGFMRSLQEENINPKGKAIVLLGAGGAARAIGVELALAGIERIHIVNRNEGRGRELATLINGNSSAKAEYVKWDRKYSLPEGTDILVNGTSIGFAADMGSRPDIDYDGIHQTMVVCDVVPNPPRTRFLQEAESRGAKTLDGLGMLVYQGAIGFKMWTGKEASVEAMKDGLKRALNLK